ncbi:MAG: hypothetical protein NC413_04355 [Muribaculum sp.]|nr:hypothetical protein [Muribaculum sp.]
MIQYYESVFYNTLDELQATHKHNHPDILRLEKKYGEDVQFSRISHRKGVEPGYELCCYKIKKEEKQK